MALILHDWFATSRDGVSRAQQMIDQSNLFCSLPTHEGLGMAADLVVDP